MTNVQSKAMRYVFFNRMSNWFLRSGSRKFFLAVLITLQLVACGGGGGGSSSVDSASAIAPDVAADVVLGGSVGDGPVTGAQVDVYSNSGQLIGSMVSDQTASFKSTLKVKGNAYPLLLKVSGGIDLVTGMQPDFQLLSVMLKPSDKQVNINPFSTLIVKIAQSMPGGLNDKNVAVAKGFVTGRLGFGLDLSLLADPVTSTVTDSNVANLVKSSEALGELVRRTRDLIAATGTALSGDGVVAALAADMVDGYPDGLGAQGTRPAVTAVVNVISGQVLVEALSNNLRVGGVIATAVIDQSIVTTRPGITGGQLTDSVHITRDMLDQTRVALAAAQVLDAGAAVEDVKTRVGTIPEGSLASEVSTSLPADASFALDYAITLAPGVDDAQVVAINQVASSDGNVAPVVSNSMPLISGSPATSVTANNSYVFQPGASDADGDSLVFSITGKPAWASFNSATGKLSGTPSDSEAGRYSNIVIAVTDGMDTASLPAFSIRVDAAVAINTAPAISGIPATAVTANSSYVFLPGAVDADGDTLAFSITNKPGWASFNTATGRLNGTPANSDAATYGNIVIAVTDGIASAALPAFSVRVDAAAAQTGSFTLNWSAPVARADGSALSLSDINGFRIHYGTTPGNYTGIYDVTNGSAQSATVSNLPVGTYYVVMTTYDTAGLESGYSAEISKSAL